MRLTVLSAAVAALILASCETAAPPAGGDAAAPVETPAIPAGSRQLLEDLRILSHDDMEGATPARRAVSGPANTSSRGWRRWGSRRL